MGTFDQMHPLVLQILDQCAPRQNRRNQYYENFIAMATYGDIKKSSVPLSGVQQKLIEERIRSVMPERKFFDLMSAFALGMQYTLRKVGDIKADALLFSNELPSLENEEPYTGFLAAAGYKEGTGSFLIINPLNLTKGCADPELFAKGMDHPAGLTLQEHMVLAGVEEMLHLHQSQHGKNAQYKLSNDNMDMDAYHNDPLEKEADILIKVAIRELGLGPENRGIFRK